MYDINSWGISKQYLAAHYYLSEERPISISEAQRAQLGALHLHVSYGTYNDSLKVPDLMNCTISEKKKRISEWKKLGTISRVTAMKLFIDLISSLFPNWPRFRKLYHEFEQEWQNMPDFLPAQKPEPPKLEQLKRPERKKIDYRAATPSALKKIMQNKKERHQRAKSRIIERYESPQLIIRRDQIKKEKVSKFPKINKCMKQYNEKTGEFLKEFVEDLQSHRGGNLRKTSATKFPGVEERIEFSGVKYHTPEVNMDKELSDYRKKLLVQEICKISGKSYEDGGYKKIIPNVHEKLKDLKAVLLQMEEDYKNIDLIHDNN